MRKMLDAALESGAEVMVLTSPASKNAQTNLRLPYFVRILRELHRDYPQVALIDVYGAYQREQRRGADLDALLMDDWHPTVQGHRVIARAIMASEAAR
jgi:lysophospholipase L1-like esterase